MKQTKTLTPREQGLLEMVTFKQRVIDYFLPPETNTVLELMDRVVHESISEVFTESIRGHMTLEQFAQILANMTFDTLHNTEGLNPDYILEQVERELHKKRLNRVKDRD